jgi:DNA-binding LacI/PurR family transcriptional regulator/signal transduction histidine kinase
VGILRRIVFVTPQLTTFFSQALWYSLQDAASGLGVRLTALLGGPLDRPDRPLPGRRVYDLLDQRNFDGVLLFSGALGTASGPTSVSRLIDALGHLPTVSIGVVQDGVCSVAIDQAGAVAQLVKHLHDDHGHRRFCFVTGHEGQVEAEARRNAFWETVRGLRIPESQIEEFHGDFTRMAGAEAVRALAPRLKPPLALVCSNDLEALGALDECRLLGIEVPEQLAVVGFDDIDLAVFQEPGLTSVRQPFVQQAGRALALLVRLIDGERTLVQEVTPAQVLLRASCGCRPELVMTASNKAELVAELLATQSDATESFRSFLRGWIPEYLTAFESFLETGNSSVLAGQWALYQSRWQSSYERGLPLRPLFSGLENLYSRHPGFGQATRENLWLAGAAEARKGIRSNWASRASFRDIHQVELAIGQIKDWKELAGFPLRDQVRLGVSGVALVKHGNPPALVYYRTSWSGNSTSEEGKPVEYPGLPSVTETLDGPAHRIVVALTTEKTYWGYGVFWIADHETAICDYLAHWFAGALQRIELLERVERQSQSLRVSLEETRRMQEQLIETEKVASLGRLVAGVAHEINTPLGTGITGTSFLLDKLKDVSSHFSSGTLARSGLVQFFSQGREALEGVLRNLMKAGELIQAFKGLGLDHGQGEWKPVELRTLFGDLETLYAQEFSKRGVALRCELPESGTLIYSQASALVQVVGELLENALEHAFPEGFRSAPQILLQVEVLESALRLAVTDNGRGLEEDERRHLFDPLFTTRRTQGHSGLGLHLAFRLVTMTLGGRMTVASERGAGSSFLCLIPKRPPGGTVDDMTFPG